MFNSLSMFKLWKCSIHFWEFFWAVTCRHLEYLAKQLVFVVSSSENRGFTKWMSHSSFFEGHFRELPTRFTDGLLYDPRTPKQGSPGTKIEGNPTSCSSCYGAFETGSPGASLAWGSNENHDAHNIDISDFTNINSSINVTSPQTQRHGLPTFSSHHSPMHPFRKLAHVGITPLKPNEIVNTNANVVEYKNTGTLRLQCSLSMVRQNKYQQYKDASCSPTDRIRAGHYRSKARFLRVFDKTRASCRSSGGSRKIFECKPRKRAQITKQVVSTENPLWAS
jgi:hypothetical protein